MSDTNMPTTEAKVVNSEQELASYELAYHVLPTVAEGEVITVTDELKALINKASGQIFDEEAAERFELAYEIDKYIEGKYRNFASAYFGWIRFTLAPGALATLVEQVESNKQILRSLTIRLTKKEEANPFRFHEALVDTKVRIIDTDALDTEIVEGVEAVDTDGIIDEEVVIEAVAKIA